MINEPTVFILGAGASVPYGFPTSEKLTKDICDLILGNAGKVNPEEIERATGVPFESYTGMAQALLDAGSVSIDTWLSIPSNKDFLQCGKICIAREIASQEGTVRNPDRDWYAELWSKYLQEGCSSLKDLRENIVTLITFNYDRSLEHHLLRMCRATFKGEADEDIYETINSVNIFHLHGSLGSLRWQKGASSTDELTYQPHPRWTTAKRCATRIKIISEQNPRDINYEKARQALYNADRVYFLGFGYHDENLSRLRSLKPKDRIRAPTNFIRGSAYKLNPREYEGLRAGNNPLGVGIVLGETNHDVLEFLRSKVPRT